MERRQKIIYSTIFVITILLALSIFLESYNRSKNQPVAPPSISPVAPKISVIPTSEVFTDPPVKYREGTLNKSIDALENKKDLTTNDKAVKEKLLARVKGTFGVIYQTKDYTIYYVDAPDDLEVEILTTDITRAKDGSYSWLISQGLSKEGLCNFPVFYYLNYNISQQLRGSGLEFNPLPQGC